MTKKQLACSKVKTQECLQEFGVLKRNPRFNFFSMAICGCPKTVCPLISLCYRYTFRYDTTCVRRNLMLARVRRQTRKWTHTVHEHIRYRHCPVHKLALLHHKCTAQEHSLRTNRHQGKTQLHFRLGHGQKSACHLRPCVHTSSSAIQFLHAVYISMQHC